MYANPAPLTSRAVVAVDVLHFILTDHNLDVVVSIVSLKQNVYFLGIFIWPHWPGDAVASAWPPVPTRPPGLGSDLGNAWSPAEVHGRAVWQHGDRGVSPDVVSEEETVERKVHYRMLTNLSLETWRASPPHPWWFGGTGGGLLEAQLCWGWVTSYPFDGLGTLNECLRTWPWPPPNRPLKASVCPSSESLALSVLCRSS